VLELDLVGLVAAVLSALVSLLAWAPLRARTVAPPAKVSALGRFADLAYAAAVEACAARKGDVAPEPMPADRARPLELLELAAEAFAGCGEVEDRPGFAVRSALLALAEMVTVWGTDRGADIARHLADLCDLAGDVSRPPTPEAVRWDLSAEDLDHANAGELLSWSFGDGSADAAEALIGSVAEDIATLADAMSGGATQPTSERIYATLCRLSRRAEAALHLHRREVQRPIRVLVAAGEDSAITMHGDPDTAPTDRLVVVRWKGTVSTSTLGAIADAVTAAANKASAGAAFTLPGGAR
jgi:hypothetical protein